MNASALSTLRMEFKGELDIIQKSIDKDKDDIKELKEILNPNNMVYNIAIGDVLSVIDYLERLDISFEQSCFLFIMKTMYSITLFKWYDTYTDQLDYERRDNNAKGQVPKDVASDDISDLQSDTVPKRSLFEDMKLPEYFKLLGGRLFNTQINVVLPTSDKTNIYRSARIINKEALNKLIEKCCGDNASSDEIMMAEFFMLCTARTINRRNDKTKSANYNEPDFRTGKSLAYREDVGTTSNPYFDLSSFLYNVLTYEQCVSRFQHGKELLKKIESLESEPHPIAANHSLHSAFRFFTGTDMRFDKSGDYKHKIASMPVGYAYNQDEDTRHRFISWAAIRNYEVLADLVSFMDEQEYRGTGDDIAILKMFFTKLSSYNIYSYDLRNEGDNPSKSDNYHSINIRFASVVSNFLDSVAEDKSLNEEFNAIYNGFNPSANTKTGGKETGKKDGWQFDVEEFRPKTATSKQALYNKIYNTYKGFEDSDRQKALQEVFAPGDLTRVSSGGFDKYYKELMSKLQQLDNGTTPSND